MTSELIPNQLWTVDGYFLPERLVSIRNLYRKSRIPLSMQYDNRVLSDWSQSIELQNIVCEETQRVADTVKQHLAPQVAYVSLDLSGSSIMMHRLHPEIFVQCQIVLGDSTDANMDFAFCADHTINNQSALDYRPIRPITQNLVQTAPYAPNVASLYVNSPRGFVGMLGTVPANTVREVLVLSYTRAN
jgi:hypothetical protein